MSVCLSIRLVDGFVVGGIDVIYFIGWIGRGGWIFLAVWKLLENPIDELQLIVVVDGDDINAESFLRMCC